MPLKPVPVGDERDQGVEASSPRSVGGTAVPSSSGGAICGQTAGRPSAPWKDAAVRCQVALGRAGAGDGTSAAGGGRAGPTLLGSTR